VLRRLLLTVLVLSVTAMGFLPDNAVAQEQAPETYGPGYSGQEVADIQYRLKHLAYDPGAIDGVFGEPLQMALYAFQKVNGLPVTGTVGPEVRTALANPIVPTPAPGGEPDRVEISLPLQLLTVVRDGKVALITHMSSGSHAQYGCRGRGRRRSCKVAVTPAGAFRIGRTQLGWRSGPLGRMYSPQYFTSRGHAIHGSTSVPLQPASHGCVRIPMHTAEWFPTLVFRGMPVYIA
jgi:peptidoglycan hydrolase-like protein with peptidoglycan-binding domain